MKTIHIEFRHNASLTMYSPDGFEVPSAEMLAGKERPVSFFCPDFLVQCYSDDIVKIVTKDTLYVRKEKRDAS